MGTLVEIKADDESEEKLLTSINSAFNEIKRIDSLFSTYNPESPIYKINHSNDSIYTLPAEIYDLLKQSDYFFYISKGAFDVSINQLVTLWGFDGENPSKPADKNILSVLKNSGWSNVELLSNNRIKIKQKVELNFGAIAKGYAVDRAIEKLKEYQIEKAMVNAGGDMNVIGEWSVGIQHPTAEDFLIEKISLKNNSLATSGDYEKFFIENNLRYHHIIDPKTGYPANSCKSVSVISHDCADADALATAVFVLGPVQGLKLIESLDNTEAMIVDSDGETLYSTGFGKYVIK